MRHPTFKVISYYAHCFVFQRFAIQDSNQVTIIIVHVKLLSRKDPIIIVHVKHLSIKDLICIILHENFFL